MSKRRKPLPTRQAPEHAPLNPEVVASNAAAISLANVNLDARVEIFVADWSGLDRVRATVERRGLSNRVGVHHHLALRCPLVQTALSRAGARTVLVNSH